MTASRREPDAAGAADAPAEQHVLDDSVLRLRPLERKDAARTRHWRNDAAVWARTMGFRVPITESMEERWYDLLAADNSWTRVVFGAETIADGELIGLGFLNEVDWPSRTAVYGILIGSAASRGHGHGRRLERLVVRYAAEHLGLRKLTLRVLASNEVSVRLHRGAGWVEEGRQRAQFLVGGAYEDVILMARFLELPVAAPSSEPEPRG